MPRSSPHFRSRTMIPLRQNPLQRNPARRRVRLTITSRTQRSTTCTQTGHRPASTRRSGLFSVRCETTFGKLPAREFGPKKLKQIQQDMIELNWSRSYINKATGIVKRCFAWVRQKSSFRLRRLTSLIPVKGLKKGRTAARERPKVTPVSDEAVEATLPFALDWPTSSGC